ncbi:hypothetical protein C1H46_029447 [Malus baccata]|uniref:Uncharacterized protein n=1 Tax=Malus baccata TaxID=106549 RepID=A0A540LEU3_MALBA|nr:hypothetical protein C1H46_029447 [Malus baccata]
MTKIAFWRCVLLELSTIKSNMELGTLMGSGGSWWGLTCATDGHNSLGATLNPATTSVSEASIPVHCLNHHHVGYCTTSSVETKTNAKSKGSMTSLLRAVRNIRTSDNLGNPSLSNHVGKPPSYSFAVRNSLPCNNSPLQLRGE